MSKDRVRRYTTHHIGFPYYLYDFTNHGAHTGEQELVDEADLRCAFDVYIPRALEQKRKLQITDERGHCVLHLEQGKIVFPKRSDFKDFDHEIMVGGKVIKYRVVE